MNPQFGDLRFGDLVLTSDGYFGLVIGDTEGTKVLIAVANGTEQELEAATLIRLPLAPGAASPANFAEWVKAYRP